MKIQLNPFRGFSWFGPWKKIRLLQEELNLTKQEKEEIAGVTRIEVIEEVRANVREIKNVYARLTAEKIEEEFLLAEDGGRIDLGISISGLNKALLENQKQIRRELETEYQGRIDLTKRLIKSEVEKIASKDIQFAKFAMGIYVFGSSAYANPQFERRLRRARLSNSLLSDIIDREGLGKLIEGKTYTRSFEKFDIDFVPHYFTKKHKKTGPDGVLAYLNSHPGNPKFVETIRKAAKSTSTLLKKSIESLPNLGYLGSSPQLETEYATG